ncbi:GAT domain-containing protein [Xylariales sp. AK1849]|nr:GAT domain-containing protein [Xylariales sp. AK1849]
MKSLKMGKVLGTIRRKKDGNGPQADHQKDSPEAVAAQSVKAFCESGGANSSGDEVLYLPPIVDAAESSPQAAAECARLIRKYLKRDYWTKASYQYNAIMLMRILADNPGPTFTRNLDQKCVDTLKELLRNGRDPSVQQILMETFNAFENTKEYDEGLALLIAMWKKEKEKAQKLGGRTPQQVPRAMNAPLVDPQAHDYHSQNYFSRNHTNRRLPDPAELASRLEEARTSAKLLQEVVTNTPPGEVLDNEFIREFADRCTSASRSVQLYMTAGDPAPDNDTMENLIDTNEQLQASLSLHQRAMLNARKYAGVGVTGEGPDSSAPSPSPTNGLGPSRRPSPPNPATHEDLDYDPPPMPPPRTNGKGKEKEYDNAIAGPSRSHTPAAEEDPFRDPGPEPSGSVSRSSAASGAGGSRYLDENPRLAYEPFHPGFSATPSYLVRQESALGKETMHGAVNASSETRPSRADDDEDGLYDATPQRSKVPTYRY